MNLVAEGKEREELLTRAGKLPSIKITMRNMCDLELIATGGFSPLTTFMGKADYDRVLKEMRLAELRAFQPAGAALEAPARRHPHARRTRHAETAAAPPAWRARPGLVALSLGVEVDGETLDLAPLLAGLLRATGAG